MESTLVCSTLTAKAPAGLAVILLAGPGAAQILDRCFRRPGGQRLPPVDRAAYGMIWRGDEPIDEVLVIPTARARAERFDICCHSGAAVARAIVDLFVSLGARQLPWSRLIPEGTLDYDLVRALLAADGSDQALGLATLLGGTLRQSFQKIVDALEAPHENDREELLETLRDLRRTASIGRHLAQPPTVVITGPPNSGKSTLFNAIVGESRALTSHFAGTTRDPVETLVVLAGFAVRLVDTAGESPADADPLVREGTAAAARVAADADLEIRLVPWGEQVPADHEADRAVLHVLSKADLAGDTDAVIRSSRPVFAVSALSNEGVDRLLDEVGNRLGFEELRRCDGPVLVTPKQVKLVDDALDLLENNRPRKRPADVLDSLKTYLGRCDLLKPGN